MTENDIKAIVVIGLIVVVLGLGIGLPIYFHYGEGKRAINELEQQGKEIDMESNYDTYLQAEKDLRSYKASYESDKITYISNKDSDDKVNKQLAQSAKTRANRTAATYNELLKTTLYQKVNLPEELKEELPYIE